MRAGFPLGLLVRQTAAFICQLVAGSRSACSHQRTARPSGSGTPRRRLTCHRAFRLPMLVAYRLAGLATCRGSLCACHVLLRQACRWRGVK